MKKILYLGFTFVVVGAIWFWGNSQLSKDPIVFTAADEDLQDNGTISDGIHNTSMFLSMLLEDSSDFSEIHGLETLKEYSKGAVQLAEKRNADKSIKEKLIQTEQLIHEAEVNKNITKLQEANEILKKLDIEFNKDVL
ncbi:hypothetical protein [Cytobacillus massiliigabonensis]|uniref:hypothetical protein n=1 Tax=Cytobacillus massiliigabonensis TaxID=1871011 RepID=UPI000C850984|nr:hypothetical protein [Cytobacillus massiliigabonensis]